MRPIIEAMVRATKMHNVQCLRAVAALLVIAVHEPDYERSIFGTSFLAWARVPGGTGVDLFFVISGFIMVTTMWNAFGRSGSARAFLVRRIQRIYPVYWILTFAFLAFHALLVHEGPRFAPLDEIIASLFLVPHGSDPVLSVGWTLQHEMVFYLIFALALLFSRPALIIAFAAWALVVLAGPAIDACVPSAALRLVASPLNLEFLFGAAVGAAAASGRTFASLPLLWAGTCGFAVVFAITSPLPELPSTWFRALVVAPPMALVLAGAVGSEVQKRLTGPRALARLGDASYSLYLSHLMVLGTVALGARAVHAHGVAMHVVVVIAGYLACVGVALVLYRTVEKPLLESFRTTGPRGRAPNAAVTATAEPRRSS
jgi:exopolysaccharide production protein ExoZ